jgi:hypothetical protein
VDHLITAVFEAVDLAADDKSATGVMVPRFTEDRAMTDAAISYVRGAWRALEFPATRRWAPRPSPR